MDQRPQPFTLPFLRREQVNFNTYSFFFDRSAYAFSFKPGQYLRMNLQIEHPDDRANFRYFSIASSPTREREIMITTHVIQSAFKKQMLTFIPGQEINFMGPFGEFTFEESDTRSRVFLAGGIGITPFHSMIQYSFDKNLSLPITLFASFKIPEEFVFFDELSQVAQINNSIKVVYTVTRPEESKTEWNGEIGRINEELLKRYIANVQDTVYYIVGSEKMVDATEELVRSLGVTDEYIRTESFPGY